MYTLVCGNSRFACKSDSRLLCERLVEDTYGETDSGIVVMSSIASRAAMMSVYEYPDNKDVEGVKCFYSIDEMANLFTVSRKDWALESQGLLIKLWGNPHSERHDTAKENIYAYKPSAHIYGCSTVKWLHNTMKSVDVEGGFINRFFCFYSDGLLERIPSNQQFIHQASLNKFLSKLECLSTYKSDAITYHFSDEALEYFDLWAGDLFREQRENQDEVGSARHEDYTSKIALLFHILNDPKEREIELSTLQNAIELSEYSRKVASYVLRGVVNNKTAVLEQKIMSFIEKRKNNTTKKEVQAGLQRDGYKIVGELLDSLIQYGLIVENNGVIFIPE